MQTKNIPQLLPSIQERLLEAITTILTMIFVPLCACSAPLCWSLTIHRVC